jgi:hypothetical protein
MHIDRRLVGFGLFLITVGAVMIAVRQGLIGQDDAQKAWTLWPLILLGVGLSIVLAGRPGAAIGGLVLALTFGDAIIDVNFGSATLRLPNRGLTGSLSVNAGSAALCLPDGAGLRVKLDSTAASNDFADHGLTETNGVWETPAYDSAEVRLDLRAQVSAGSLALDPTRQCTG